MLVYAIAGASLLRLLSKIGPIQKMLSKASGSKLNTGIGNTTKELPVIDSIIEKYAGVSLTRIQRVSVGRFIKLVRQAVNTRAFELVVAKMVHDKWPGSKPISNEVRLY